MAFVFAHRWYFAFVAAALVLCAVQAAMAAPYPSMKQDVAPQAAPVAQLAAPAQQASLQPVPAVQQAATADYRLGTGDKVHVTVFNEDDLSGDFTVDAGGTLRLPLVGQVSAAGLSPAALERNIAFALANGYVNDPKVNVEVVTFRPFYILGEVNRPGEYPYASGMSALKAVSVAGGFTQKAQDSVIYVRREGEAREQRLAADDGTKINPGDTVRVGESGLWTLLSIAQPVAAIVAPRW